MYMTFLIELRIFPQGKKQLYIGDLTPFALSPAEQV
jgi:hypothetical protein